jgi:ribosomal protein L7/L12
MSTPHSDWENEVRSLLAQGRKLEAVKVYKEHTGASLAAAKEAVEAMEPGTVDSSPAEPDSNLETELLRLLSQGRKLEAVKIYRDRWGVSLREAKEAAESLAARNGIQTQGGGCLGVVVILVIIFVVVGVTVW